MAPFSELADHRDDASLVRALLLTRFLLGWFEREPDWNAALQAVSSIRLLTKETFRALFPEASIY